MEFVDLLKYYLSHNFALLVIAVGFFLLYMNRNSRLKHHSRLLLIDMIVLLLLSVSTTIEYCFEALKVTYPIQYVAVIFGYTLRPAVVYLIIVTFLKPTKKGYFLLALPIIIGFVFTSTSPATHWIFYYGENNVFVRNMPWGYLPHLVAGFYLAFLAGLMVKLFREDDKTQAIASVFILLANGIATALETLDVVEDILCTTMGASILFYFMTMFTYFRKRDSLTGLLDRHTFYIDFSAHKNHVTALIGFDLNGLKRINDSLGHASGDVALKSISRVFLSFTDKKLKFYRLGGDEFEAICLEMSEEEIKAKIEQIDEAIARIGYVCSSGYCMKEKDDTVDLLLRRADEAMYQSKRDYYKRELEASKDKPS